MFYKDIAKVKDGLTKSYYKQLNDIIMQGVAFFSAPDIMDYLQHCINEISSYYDSVLNAQVEHDSGAFVDSIVKDALKDEKA